MIGSRFDTEVVNGNYNPHKSLRAAVIVRAILDAMSEQHATGYTIWKEATEEEKLLKREELSAEALEWLGIVKPLVIELDPDPDDDRYFTFEGICQDLDLDPSLVRGRIGALLDEGIQFDPSASVQSVLLEIMRD